jgi:hypothetical protein
MTSDAVPDASPDASTALSTASVAILPGQRRGSEARLEQGVLILGSPVLERRIPVAAIERVEAAGPKGHSLVVVLTAPDADRPDSWTVNGRSAPAVHAFAQALRQVLPVRDATESRADGALLVTDVPVTKPPTDWRRTALRISVSLYLLLAAVMLIAGVLGGYEWYGAVVCWLAGSIAVPLRHGVRAGGEMIREVWRLRTCGILVEGRRLYAGTYEFTDAEGRIHSLTGTSESADRVEILYDPEGQAPAQVGRGTVGTLALAVIVFLLSLAMTTALAALGLAGPFVVLG